MVSEKIRSEVMTFLRANLVCVIATVDGDKPEAATIHFLADDEMNLFFVTRRQTRKFKNLSENPNVAIVVGTELAPRTLQIEGEAVEIDESHGDLTKLARRPGMSDIYAGAISGDPFADIKGMDFAVFKVIPNWIRWMDLDEKKKKEIYRQVVP